MARPGSAPRPPSPGRQPRSPAGAAVALLTLALAGAVALSVAIGPSALPWNATLAILVHQLTGGYLANPPCGSVAPDTCRIWTEIVWNARLPDLLLAVSVGAALGVSGAGLQGIFRNPLADPYLLGLSSGAALGASSVYTFSIDPAGRAFVLPLFAFVGGLVPGTVIYSAAHSRSASAQTLLLTGVALNALFSAVLATLLLYNPVASISVSFWLLGDLSYGTWTTVGLVAPVVLVAGLFLSLRARELNLIQLGPDVAQSLGTDPRKVTREVVIVTTVMTAAAVAFAGVIGFVGLVAPHVVRRLVGVDYRRVVGVSAVAGGAFLVVAWDLAQTVLRAVVIPVGIPMAFFGALFFLYLLYRRSSVGGGMLRDG